MILKSSWFWAFVVGVIIGLYAGYHAGLVSGYEHALDALKRIAPGLAQ